MGLVWIFPIIPNAGEYIDRDGSLSKTNKVEDLLGSTKDGKQVSDNWIENRLDSAVANKRLELVMPIFKNSIDYSKVRVHKGEFLWFGIQDNYTAMTPEGDMYFPEEIYEDDFAFVNPYLFIHEMVHVWQYQLGHNVLWNGFLVHFLKLGFLSKGDSELKDILYGFKINPNNSLLLPKTTAVWD